MNGVHWEPGKTAKLRTRHIACMSKSNTPVCILCFLAKLHLEKNLYSFLTAQLEFVHRMHLIAVIPLTPKTYTHAHIRTHVYTCVYTCTCRAHMHIHYTHVHT